MAVGSGSQRLTYRASPEGDSTLEASGPAVVAGILVVLLALVLVLAPEHKQVAAGVTGVVLGGGMSGFGWAVLVGHIAWSDVWKGSFFRAKRDSSGRLSLDGIGHAAWPLGGLLCIGLIYLLAPAATKVLWIALLAAVVGVAIIAFLIRRRGSG